MEPAVSVIFSVVQDEMNEEDVDYREEQSEGESGNEGGTKEDDDTDIGRT